MNPEAATLGKKIEKLLFLPKVSVNDVQVNGAVSVVECLLKH
jgi:hypothetical protein